MKLPTGVWITTLTLAALAGTMSRRPEASCGAAVLGERTELVVARPAPRRATPLLLQEAVTEIKRRLEDQPAVRSAVVRVESGPGLDIYVRWDDAAGGPELGLPTIAAWAASIAEDVGRIVVRDSAGRSHTWSRREVARR